MPVSRLLLATAALTGLLLAACGVDPEPAADAALDSEAAPTGKGKPEDIHLPDEAPPTLQIEDLVEGTGAVVAAHDWVRVDYVGVALSTGEEFDSSYDREPVEFSLDGVVVGWSEGLLGMREGGRRHLVIPADMAYGDQPPAGSNIAPGETLVFVVDLLEVTVAYADKPTVEMPETAPTELVVEDIEIGDGAEVSSAEPGTMLTVQYVGVSLDSGEVFDSTWDSGNRPATFDITQVIPGWSDGLIGMREGGRRRLIIPPELGYGDTPPAGSAIAPGDTLVFVVDLLEVG